MEVNMLFQCVSEFCHFYSFHIQFLVGSRMLLESRYTSKVQHEHKALYNAKLNALCYKLKVSHIAVAIIGETYLQECISLSKI